MRNSQNTLSLQTKRQVIASRKRRGDVTRVAKQTGYSTSYVSEVLNSLYTNQRILNAAYRMTRGRAQNTNRSKN